MKILVVQESDLSSGEVHIGIIVRGEIVHEMAGGEVNR